jgi:hypothetical protein
MLRDKAKFYPNPALSRILNFKNRDSGFYSVLYIEI